MITEIIGIFLTVVLLIWIIDTKEYEKWKKVKDAVHKNLGIEIGGIFTDLSNLCEFDSPLTVVNKLDWDEIHKKDFEVKIKELSEKGEITLNSVGKDILLERGYGNLFIERRNRLSDIESKYLTFFDTLITDALMKIQDNLYELDLIIRMKKGGAWFKSDDDIFFKSTSYTIYNILKEISKLHYGSSLVIP